MTPMDTPNREKQKQREQLAADVEAFLAAGGRINTEAGTFRPLTKGPDQSDHINTVSAAAILGFSEPAILQSLRTGVLGGHPAPDFIKHRANGRRLFLREAVYQWVEKYGKGGCKGVPRTESEDGMLTLLEVSALVGLSRPTIYKYMRDGQFPENTKGKDRRTYWRESEVNQWLIENRSEAA